MQSQGQRTVLHLVPKGKLHFIAVLPWSRTCQTVLQRKIRIHFCQKLLHLGELQLLLVFIVHRLIGTSSALRKMWAGRQLILHLRMFQHLRQYAFRTVFSGLLQLKLYFLARQSILHKYRKLLSLYLHTAFIGKF